MSKIIVFGTGKYGKEAYDFFGDDNVLCFADNNAALTGKYLYEKEIFCLVIYNLIIRST